MVQRTLVLPLAPARAVALRSALAAGEFEFRPAPHAVFSAKGEGIVATAYHSGKLVLQGSDPEAFAARWLDGADARAAGPSERERPPSAAPPVVATIGSDEVGKGDYFGPLVVAAVRLEAGESEEIARAGFRDSKTLSDAQCLRLGGALRSRYAHAIERLDPPDYNRTYRPGKLNELLADLHQRAIERLARPGIRVVVDRFADERLLQRRLAPLGIALEQRTRAESEPAVGAASVLAREEFLLALKQLSEETAVDLHKGAGDPADRAGRRFVALHGPGALERVAKMHFKNTHKVLRSGGGCA